MGVICWRWRRGTVYAYVFRVVMYNSVYHLFSVIEYLDTLERDMSVNRKLLAVYPTPYRSLVWKLIPITRLSTTWVMCGDLYLTALAFPLQENYTTSHNLYLESVARVLYIVGRYTILVTLHIRQREIFWSYHLSNGITYLFTSVIWGDAVGSAWVMWVGARGNSTRFSGTNYLHIFFCPLVNWSYRSSDPSIVTTLASPLSNYLIHAMRSFIAYTIYISVALTCTRAWTEGCDRNGGINSGATNLRREI